MAIKILILTQFTYPHSGGISSHISTLKKELEKRGFKVDVLSLSSLGLLGLFFIRIPSFLLNKLDNGLGYLYRYPLSILLLGFVGFILNIKNKYSIFHAHDVIAYNSAILAKVFTNKEVVLTIHGYLFNEAFSQNETKERYRSFFLFYEKSVKTCKKILAADNRIKDYLIKEIGINEKFIRAYKNFIDPQLFKPLAYTKEDLRIRLGLPVGKKIIFCPRRLVVKNGVIFAIKSMEYLSDDYILLIAGTGPEEQTLKKAAKKIGETRVRFLGKVDNSKIAEYYCAADYTVIPSITAKNVEEATSISAIESMACGTPVIGSSIGGIKELIKDRDNGLLVQQQDPKAIANAILLLDNNIELRNKIIKNATEIVMKELTVSVFVDSLLSKEYKDIK